MLTDCLVCFESKYKKEYVKLLKSMNKEKKEKYLFNISLNTTKEYLNESSDIGEEDIVCYKFSACDTRIAMCYYSFLRNNIPNVKIYDANSLFVEMKINYAFNKNLFSKILFKTRPYLGRWFLAKDDTDL
jgi:hypothetical protein